MENVKVGQIYRHYKGNLYEVLGIAKHSETLEDMVVYKSAVNGGIWVRPIRMWNEIVDDNGTLRFTPVN